MENESIIWDQTTEQQFKKLLEKIPLVLRATAQKKVSVEAQRLVEDENPRYMLKGFQLCGLTCETVLSAPGAK